MAVGLLVFLLALMHGVFGSGFIPIIRAAAPTYAPLAFGIYFFGMLAGQLAIVASPALRTRRLLLPLYELVFAASLLGMAAMFGWQPGCLILGRLFEGFAGGLAVPLMFFWVCRSRGFGSVARRISIFNSLIALGFVIGPQLMAWVLDLTTAVVALASFGLAFVAAAAALAPALPTDLPPLDPALGLPALVLLGVAGSRRFFFCFWPSARTGSCCPSRLRFWPTSCIRSRSLRSCSPCLASSSWGKWSAHRWRERSGAGATSPCRSSWRASWCFWARPRLRGWCSRWGCVTRSCCWWG